MNIVVMTSAIIDTSVLSNRLQRDILLWFANKNLFKLTLSYDILDEFERMISRRLGKKRSEVLVQNFKLSFQDSIFEPKVYESNFQLINHVNRKDQHLAALSYAKLSTIITLDKGLQRELELEGLPHSQPDDFIFNIISNYGKKSIPALKKAKELHENSKSSPISADEFILMLKNNCLTKSANILKQFENLL